MYIYIRSLTRNLPKIYILSILYIYIYVHNGLVMDVRVRRLVTVADVKYPQSWPTKSRNRG